MKKNIILSSITALIVSLLVIVIYSATTKTSQTVIIKEKVPNGTKVLYTKDKDGNITPLDFTTTTDKVLNSVVNISTYKKTRGRYRGTYKNRNLPDSFFDDFFGDSPNFRKYHHKDKSDEDNKELHNKQVSGMGSGVVISENGHIITNYHVVEGADELSIKLHDNRIFKAKIVGTDPSTDLALLHIKADHLTPLNFIDSNQVKVGEWVLAVGNPFSLSSTVTAGIVSAKARNININPSQFAVESFIQTDAAINPGNSGGALVDLEGNLVGINTAIASRTGTYNGYGFAVPSNIVNKVVEDLLTYGNVQRGIMGINIRTLDGTLAKEKDLDIVQGVYVEAVGENSGAEDAGIKSGDVVISVDGVSIKSSPKLQETVAQKRPGDKIMVGLYRNGKEITKEVELKNRNGNNKIIDKRDDLHEFLGISLEELSEEEKSELSIDSGLRISKLGNGQLSRHTQVREGFIITQVNGILVNDLKTFEKIVKKYADKGEGIMLRGVYEDLDGVYYYAFGMD